MAPDANIVDPILTGWLPDNRALLSEFSCLKEIIVMSPPTASRKELVMLYF